MDLKRRVVAEAVGTAFLLAAVVGSGIMGERLSMGNQAVALLVNTLATGTALVALIYCFAPISGAHFNPVVTLALACRYRFGWREVPWYLAAQMVGAIIGIIGAHGMFVQPWLFVSHHARTGMHQFMSETVATFGLLLVIFSSARYRKEAISFAVGAYIAAAYWFTSSTSFANPAVTVARMLSDTFTGIRPADVPVFILAQFLGAGAATLLAVWLLPEGAGKEDT
jgi:glycerol uptake facilitator-like aquaporin